MGIHIKLKTENILLIRALGVKRNQTKELTEKIKKLEEENRRIKKIFSKILNFKDFKINFYERELDIAKENKKKYLFIEDLYKNLELR